MESLSDFDESRRRFLLAMLAGSAGTLLTGCTTSNVSRLMTEPALMPADKSVYLSAGSSTVNGVAVALDTRIQPGDVIETGPKSELVFVSGEDAFLLRSETRFRLPGSAARAEGYQLEAGKALGVFATGRSRVTTPNAIVGIRGTGVYFETDPERSYVCTCYGTTDLQTADAAAVSETVTAEHHDAPKYILADTARTERIVAAPFVNHDDQELLMLETLVGRTTPYVVPKNIKRSRRNYI